MKRRIRSAGEPNQETTLQSERSEGLFSVKGLRPAPWGRPQFSLSKRKLSVQRRRCRNLQVKRGFLPGDINDGAAWLRHRQHREFENVLGMGGIGRCCVIVRQNVLVAHVLPPGS